MNTNLGLGGSTSTTQGFSQPVSQDTRTIEGRVADFAAAWNKHDPARMASLWAEDGDLINPFGRFASGRAQVEQLFREEHQGPMKNSTHQIGIDSIRLLGSELAIVEGDCKLTGIRSPDGKEVSAIKPHISFVMGKIEGNWKILAARAYLYSSMPGVAS